MAEAAVSLTPVESPCNQVCRLDDSGCCVGCFRTGTEIAEWLSYSHEQRRSIMAELPDRADRLFD